MKMGICAAVKEETALGLSLAGLEEILIWDGGDDPVMLKDWYRSMVEMDLGMMILSSKCAEVLHHELFESRAQGRMLPITVIIPGEEEDRRAVDLIKRAVGMDPTKQEGKQ
ncbi:MAG: V-type ATP synthase subunit F [Thermoplasmatota archaeon]